MRLLTLITCLTFCAGCSLSLDLEQDFNEDYQYDNILVKFASDAESDWSLVLHPYLQPITIATDSSNNTVIVGSYEGIPDLGGGPFAYGGGYGLFVAKYNPEGVHIWSRGFGETHKAQSSGAFQVSPDALLFEMALDELDNIIITGSFETETLDFGGGPLEGSNDTADIFLAKLDTNGNTLWAKSFISDPEDHETGAAVAADQEGNIILTGLTKTTLDLGNGEVVEGGYLASFSPDGTLLWSKTVCPVNKCWDMRLSVSRLGQILLTGGHLGEIDLGGGPVGNNEFSSIMAEFAALYHSNGENIWSTTFGLAGSNIGFPGCVSAFDSQDNIVAAGTVSANGYDTSQVVSGIFVSKLDQAGAHLWDAIINYDARGTWPNVHIDSLVLDSADNIILTGLFTGKLAVGDNPPLGYDLAGDAFIIKLDAAGNHIWSMQFERAIPVSPNQGIEFSFVSTSATVDASNNITFVSGSPRS